MSPELGCMRAGALARPVQLNLPMEARTMHKQCTCCGRTYDRHEWTRIALAGRTKVLMRQPGEPKWLELRNCPCGSTIAVGITDDGCYTDAELSDEV